MVDQMRIGRVTASAIFLMAAPAHFVRAQETSTAKYESSVTVYGGERFGGSLTDTTSNSNISLQSGSSFAVAVDIGLDRATQLEFFYSRQHTALSSGAFSSQANNLGLSLDNYHLGGTAFIDGEVGRGLYVMGGLGATTAKPSGGGGNADTFFSGNLGVGWMIPLASHVGLRFEARGYGIFLNNNSSIFCGGTAGCTVAVKASVLIEGEVLAGLSARF
jgi:Outer membrane protein beta-barrel domain